MSSPLRVRVSPSELDGNRVELTEERHHYVAHVRRGKLGDPLELFDGGGRQRGGRIDSVASDRTVIEITGEISEAELELHVTSLLPLIKGERMEVAVAKLTELGVAQIAPVRTQRSVVSLSGERAAKRVARFERIAADAARQSGRADVPTLAPIRDFSEAIGSVAPGATKLVFSPGEARGLRALVGEVDPSAGVALLTGPEGGLTAKELEAARSAGFEPVGLGRRILRAETAAIVAAAAVQTLLGDLGRGG